MNNEDQFKRRSFLQIVTGAIAVSAASFLGLVSSSQAAWQQEDTDAGDQSDGEDTDAGDEPDGEGTDAGDESGDESADAGDQSGGEGTDSSDQSGGEGTDNSGDNGRGLDYR